MNNIKLNSNIDETNIINDMADIFKALSDPSRLKVLNEITRKWYYLGQEERERILKDNEVTDEEKQMIVNTSNEIVKYKGMLKIGEKDKIVRKN